MGSAGKRARSAWRFVSRSVWEIGLLTAGLLLTGNAARAQTDWTTFGFNPQHTGYNPHETILSRANVSTLALSWKTTLDGPLLTQPTLLTNVSTNSGQLNLVYVATLSGSVYALNA